LTSELAPLRELIIPKAKRPETTLSLVEALRKPVETVETYIFTDSIRAYFNQVFEEVIADRGQAYWIQAEYGAGKTHFLGTLASLLGEQPDAIEQDIWDCVSDLEIQNERFQIQPKQLLPVVFSLRGEGGQGGPLERSLLDIIARETAASWESQRQQHPDLPLLRVTTDDDLLEWYRSRGEGLRSDIERFVKAETSVTLAQLRSEEGDTAAAEQIVRYCQRNELQPEIAISTKERARHIYQQIEAAGYTGMLLVMDEFAFWQDREKTDEQRAADEETLETIGHVLPRDEGANIWTIVASQKAAPTKLKGDRFKELSLLADRNQTDYYTIASHRIRDIQPNREPEVNQYYDFYRNNFKFIRSNSISSEQFADCFPFQPRAFDIIRRITRENLPSARFGIGVLYDILKRGELLSSNRLITASDLLKSDSLTDGFKDTLYEDSYRAYQEAKDGLKELELEQDERPIADNILGLLFLEHIAYLDSGIEHLLKVSDIVEATLTQSDVLFSEDTIDSVLLQLRELSQIEYQSQKQVVGDRQARFVSVESDGGRNPVNIFRRAKGKTTTDEGKLLTTWREIILVSPDKTAGRNNLLGDFKLNLTAQRRVIHNQVEYKHEVVVTDQWNSSAYGSLLDLDIHARIVLLTYPGEIDSSEILDDRIAVVAIAPLTQAAKELIRDWLTVDVLQEKYRNDATAEGEKMREFLKEKRRDIVPEIQKTQVEAYRKGKVFTRRSLGIKLSDIFRQATAEQALASLAQKLLADTYTQPLINASEFKSGKNLAQADVRKVFEGLFFPNLSVGNRNAVEHYGVGLGLTSAQNPLAFNPQNCQVFEILRQQLSQHQGRVTRIQLEKLLVAAPYGLTKELLSLYLLCFVQYGNPRSELELSPDTTIRLRNGTTPPKQRLTTDLIRQVEWSNKFDREIRVLQESQGVDWNQVVPFARILDDTLTTETDSQRKLEQEERLKRACQALGQRVEAVDNSLKSLARTLGSALPELVLAQLSPLRLLTQTADIDDFFETAQAEFESEEQLETALSDFEALENLSHLSTDLGADRAYLRQLKDSLPLTADLRESLDQVLEQFNLEQLLESPSFQESLRSQLDQIKSDYINQYRIHHRDHYQAVQTLYSDLAGAEEKLKTLERLNGISELGLPVTPSHRHRQEVLLNQLRVCSATDQELQQGLAHDPLCGRCRLELRQPVPSEPVTDWRRELDGALIEQFARLKSETVKRLLRNSETERLRALLQILESGKAEDLVGLLTDEVTQRLQSLLQQANVVSAASDVLAQIRETYPTIERQQLQEVVQAIELLLEAKFEEVEQENPGKTVRINLE
jgi:hypothetical protein